MALTPARKSPRSFSLPVNSASRCKKGRVDAVADSGAHRHPAHRLPMARSATWPTRRRIAPYSDEYCCAVLANGKFVAANPKAAAAATRPASRAKMGRGEPRGCVQNVRREEISCFKPGTERRGHLAPALCTECFRGGSRRQIRGHCHAKGRDAQSQHRCQRTRRPARLCASGRRHG